MFLKARKMLIHILKSRFCLERLYRACIWGGVYASVFEYRVNVRTLKALISFWNRTTHTFLTKTGEMGFSLLDMNEICDLSTYGEYYNEHIPSEDIIVQDELLNELILVHKELIQTTRKTHNKKLYCGFDNWSNEFVDIAFASDGVDKRHFFASPLDPFEILTNISETK